MLYYLASPTLLFQGAIEPVVEGTEKIGFRVPYSPVLPVCSLDCFRDRLQHALPYFRSQNQRLLGVFLGLLSVRMPLNVRPKSLRDDNQFADLVLGSSDGR